MPILHIVALKFKAEFSDEAVEKHFKEDARLKERCPDLVLDWSFSKNISLKTRADVNLGCNWVVHVRTSHFIVEVLRCFPCTATLRQDR